MASLKPPVPPLCDISTAILIRSFNLTGPKPNSYFSPTSTCCLCHNGNVILPVPQAGNLGSAHSLTNFVKITHLIHEQILLVTVLKYTPIIQMVFISAISAIPQRKPPSCLDCTVARASHLAHLFLPSYTSMLLPLLKTLQWLPHLLGIGSTLQWLPNLLRIKFQVFTSLNYSSRSAPPQLYAFFFSIQNKMPHYSLLYFCSRTHHLTYYTLIVCFLPLEYKLHERTDFTLLTTVTSAP